MTGDGRPTPTEWNMGLTHRQQHRRIESAITAVTLVKNKMADRSCRLLAGKEASDFIASMDTFIFDCDGRRRKYLKVVFGAILIQEVMWDIPKLQGCFGMKPGL